MDTSYLRGVSWRDPEFMRLLRYSKDQEVNIFISEIAWEERRTQWLERIQKKVEQANKAANDLIGEWESGFITEGLSSPAIPVLSNDDIRVASRERLGAFAKEHRLEISPPAKDHADRVWHRYFECIEPFRKEKPREERRKDIPDAWILEAAIDLLKDHKSLLGLCRDENLCATLESNGIDVYRETKEVIDIVETSMLPKAATAEAGPGEDTADGRQAEISPDELATALSEANEPFSSTERKILGYVGALDSLSKEQLFRILSGEGIAIGVAKNSAERLSLTGLIKDTGNHYLPGDKDICAQAATSVESDVIRLLGS